MPIKQMFITWVISVDNHNFALLLCTDCSMQKRERGKHQLLEHNAVGWKEREGGKEWWGKSRSLVSLDVCCVGMAGHWRTGAQETARKASKNQNSRTRQPQERASCPSENQKGVTKGCQAGEWLWFPMCGGQQPCGEWTGAEWKPFVSCVTS